MDSLTLTSPADILRIKGEYMRDEADWRRPTPIDTSSVVYVVMLQTKLILTPASEPIVTPITSSFSSNRLTVVPPPTHHYGFSTC